MVDLVIFDVNTPDQWQAKFPLDFDGTIWKMATDHVQYLQLMERVQSASKRGFVLFVKADITKTQMFHVGEDRAAECAEKAFESVGVDEVLGKCIADPSFFPRICSFGSSE